MSDLSKVCSLCLEIKPKTEFHKDSHMPDGLKTKCKCCRKINRKVNYNKNKAKYLKTMHEYSKKWRKQNKHRLRAQKAKRRAAELKRTPKWADLAKIREVYQNCPKNMEVDHIIPLQGENVSGLHVAANLQYLTPEENRSKSNKFDLQYNAN